MSALFYFREGNPPVTGGSPTQRTVTRKMVPFYDVITAYGPTTCAVSISVNDTTCKWMLMFLQKNPPCKRYADTDGLVHDCSISSTLTMEILQFCTKSSVYSLWVHMVIERLCDSKTLIYWVTYINYISVSWTVVRNCVHTVCERSRGNLLRLCDTHDKSGRQRDSIAIWLWVRYIADKICFAVSNYICITHPVWIQDKDVILPV